MSEVAVTLSVEVTPEQLRVFRPGGAAPIVIQNAPVGSRPFIHPIVSPSGVGIVTEDSPSHHPWQHGLYIGLNDVNGVGFWLEGREPAFSATDGTFSPLISTPRDGGAEDKSAEWEVRTDYLAPDGHPMLSERQEWNLADYGSHYDLDLAWTLRALEPVTFGRYEYGGLFLRMPFRKEGGGTVFNSEGQFDGHTEAQRARWVAVQMPIGGSPTGVLVALMDHPDNLEFPVPWRVDDELGIGPSACIAGSWKLGPGEEKKFQHRVSVFDAPVEPSEIDRLWTSFSEKETE